MKIVITLPNHDLQYPLLAKATDSAQLVLFTGSHYGTQLLNHEGKVEIEHRSWLPATMPVWNILPPGTVVTLTV